MGKNVRAIASLHGIAFELEAEGKIVHAVATAEYLRRRYGAKEGPEAWLESYRLAAAQIDADAWAKSRERKLQMVVLTEEMIEGDTAPAAFAR